MADSILVRFEDDVSKKLRDRARQDQKSITGFINDAVKAYLEQLSRSDQGPKIEPGGDLRRLGARLADAHHSIAEKKDAWLALSALLDCVEIMSAEEGENLDRVTWDQFLYVPENERADEQVARQMFAAQYDEISRRDWTWYLQSCHSDEEAKVVWARQRRRFGVPVPPPGT